MIIIIINNNNNKITIIITKTMMIIKIRKGLSLEQSKDQKEVLSKMMIGERSAVAVQVL
jgi:hypothetical protein